MSPEVSLFTLHRLCERLLTNFSASSAAATKSLQLPPCYLFPTFSCVPIGVWTVFALSCACSHDVFSQRREADAARAQFVHPDGDHLTLVSTSGFRSCFRYSNLCLQLNVYHAYRGACKHLSLYFSANLADQCCTADASSWCWSVRLGLHGIADL